MKNNSSKSESNKIPYFFILLFAVSFVATQQSSFAAAPIFELTSNKKVEVFQPLFIKLKATDPDGDAITLRMEEGPDNAKFRDKGDGVGLFKWIPVPLRFRCPDGAVVDSANPDNPCNRLAERQARRDAEANTAANAATATAQTESGAILSSGNANNGQAGTAEEARRNRDPTGRDLSLVFIASDGVEETTQTILVRVNRPEFLINQRNGGGGRGGRGNRGPRINEKPDTGERVSQDAADPNADPNANPNEIIKRQGSRAQAEDAAPESPRANSANLPPITQGKILNASSIIPFLDENGKRKTKRKIFKRGGLNGHRPAKSRVEIPSNIDEADSPSGALSLSPIQEEVSPAASENNSNNGNNPEAREETPEEVAENTAPEQENNRRRRRRRNRPEVPDEFASELDDPDETDSAPVINTPSHIVIRTDQILSFEVSAFDQNAFDVVNLNPLALPRGSNYITRTEGFGIAVGTVEFDSDNPGNFIFSFQASDGNTTVNNSTIVTVVEAPVEIAAEEGTEGETIELAAEESASFEVTSLSVDQGVGLIDVTGLSRRGTTVVDLSVTNMGAEGTVNLKVSIPEEFNRLVRVPEELEISANEEMNIPVTLASRDRFTSLSRATTEDFLLVPVTIEDANNSNSTTVLMKISV